MGRLLDALRRIEQIENRPNVFLADGSTHRSSQRAATSDSALAETMAEDPRLGPNAHDTNHACQPCATAFGCLEEAAARQESLPTVDRTASSASCTCSLIDTESLSQENAVESREFATPASSYQIPPQPAELPSEGPSRLGTHSFPHHPEPAQQMTTDAAAPEAPLATELRTLAERLIADWGNALPTVLLFTPVGRRPAPQWIATLGDCLSSLLGSDVPVKYGPHLGPQELLTLRQRHRLALIATDADDAIAARLATDCDAAYLCVRLGSDRLRDIERLSAAIAAVGGVVAGLIAERSESDGAAVA